jgi:transposase
MTRLPRPKIDGAFKQQAVARSYEKGRGVKEVARELGVSPASLFRWRQEFKAGVVVESDDMLKLKRENARLQMENEILKKAAAFFAKDQLKGLRS